MAAAKMIETHRGGAEIHHGEVICEETLQKFLDEFSVPRNLFQVAEVEEFGFNRSTQFFWLRQKKKRELKFKNVGTIYLDAEITGFIELRHLAKVTGVKGKERFITGPVHDMLIGVPSSDKVKVTGTFGFSRVHPIAAFELGGSEKC